MLQAWALGSYPPFAGKWPSWMGAQVSLRLSDLVWQVWDRHLQHCPLGDLRVGGDPSSASCTAGKLAEARGSRGQGCTLSLAGFLSQVPEVRHVQRPAGGGRGPPGDQVAVSRGGAQRLEPAKPTARWAGGRRPALRPGLAPRVFPFMRKPRRSSPSPALLASMEPAAAAGGPRGGDGEA